MSVHRRFPSRTPLSGALVLLAVFGGACRAADAPGVVSHVKILTDQVEDVSSMEAWKRSFIKPGMTDAQKAQAVFATVLKFRHQDIPPNEFLLAEAHVHDPIKTFNVYGYGQCCCASSNIEALARYVGLQARGWAIINHSVPEVRFDDAWHLMDASLMTTFPKPDGALASVDEITAGVMAWYVQHPEFKGDEAKLGKFMRDQGWKNGPEVLAHCPSYDGNGWLPAATHGWYSTMQEYADRGKCFLYEYGYVQGYEVNVQLRRGERLVRNWSNHGAHVNQSEGGSNGVIDGVVGKDQLRYSPALGDLAPGRIGNGTISYEPSLVDGGFRAGALVADNLAAGAEVAGKGAAMRLADPAKPGVYVVRMPCSYVYLGGALDFTAEIGEHESIAVAISDNNGLDWKDLATVTTQGAFHLDLTPSIRRRYDYRLRLTLVGARVGLDRFAITADIQHSQRALPALRAGANTVAFSAGADEGTITCEGDIDEGHADKNLVVDAFHPVTDHLSGSPLRVDGRTGSITFKLATPGDLARLRFGCHYRARDAKDGWDLQASFDGGASFTTVAHAPGGVAGNCLYVSADAPKGMREAQVRFVGTQVNTTCLLDYRIDADYREPRGGFAPVQVTYVWSEGGAEKRDVHIARTATETWPIQCGQQPVMKSLIVEPAP